MRNAVVFEAERTGYGVDQVACPMTVGQLKSILDNYDDDTLFILSHDGGYTYGSLSEYDITEQAEDEDGNWR